MPFKMYLNRRKAIMKFQGSVVSMLLVPLRKKLHWQNIFLCTKKSHAKLQKRDETRRDLEQKKHATMRLSESNF